MDETRIHTPTATGVSGNTLGGIPVESPETRKSLIYSLWDGILSNGMLALAETFAIAAAVALQAPVMAIALLSCLPLFLGSMGQFFLPGLINPKRGRKFYVLLGVRLQSAFLFLTGFMGWLPEPYAVWGYLAAFVLSGMFGNSVVGLWVAWMGDLVPPNIRGRHFAWRNSFFAWSHLSVSLTAGVVARDFTSQSAPWVLFAAVFGLAALLRYLSMRCIEKQHEPIPEGTEETRTAIWFKPSRDFLTYAGATALFQGAAAMVGPFFGVWYLRDLQFNYLTFAIAAACTVVGSIVSLPFWGRFADRHGNRLTLRISGLLICMVPLPSLYFHDPLPIWIINVFGGLSWAGYNLASFNFMLHAAGRKNQVRHIALASALTGTAILVMTLLGGFLATRLPVIFTWPLQTLFLLSAGMRLATYLLFFTRLADFGEKPQGSSEEAFAVIPGYRVGMGLLRNAFRAFRGV